MAETPVPVVLTISRQLASGGAYIGQAVARKFGLKYVDRELLHRAAEILGVQEQDVENVEEQITGFWSQLARGVFVGPPDAPFVAPPRPDVHEDEVFEVETRLIREIAARDDAVIVGRGAPHVLRDHPGVIRVFVHAPEAWRVPEVQRAYGLDEAAARGLIRDSDRRRARFVQSLIGRSWTDACLYDITVDTSIVGIDVAAEFIGRVVEARLKARGA